MPTVRRCSRLLLVPGVLTLVLPVVGAAREPLGQRAADTEVSQRYGKPSTRERAWQVAPKDWDFDRDGMKNSDDWDDDNDGLIDEDEDDQ